MARLGRYFVPGQALHVIQRGNDRGAIFFADDDYARYREWLIAASAEHRVSVHAHVLMTNHVHLLLTPETAESLPRTMQSLGRRYVRFVNAHYRRTGTLWEGRYKAAPIDSDRYLFACCRYIELNPVRARMVDHPRHYRWSSYRAHADGKDDALAAFHPVFRRLGRTVEARQAGLSRALQGGARGELRRCDSCGHQRRLGAWRRALQEADRRRSEAARRTAAARTAPVRRQRRQATRLAVKHQPISRLAAGFYSDPKLSKASANIAPGCCFYSDPNLGIATARQAGWPGREVYPRAARFARTRGPGRDTWVFRTGTCASGGSRAAWPGTLLMCRRGEDRCPECKRSGRAPPTARSRAELPTVASEESEIAADVVVLGLQHELHVGREVHDAADRANMDVDISRRQADEVRLRSSASSSKTSLGR